MLWDACLAVPEDDDDATGHVGENRLHMLLRVPAMGYHLAGWPVARDAPPVRVGTLVPLTYEPCWRCPRRLGSDACDPAVLQAFYRLHVLAMFSMQPLRLQMFLLDQARAGVVPENTVTMLRNFTETPGMPQTCSLALLPLQVVHWVCDRVACAVAYVQDVLPDGAMFTDVPLGACGVSAAEVECAMFRLFYDVRPCGGMGAQKQGQGSGSLFVCWV